jgi:predicted RNase H-like HicB family nuclease
MKELTLTCIVRKELRGGYSAICPELDVASRGDSIEEAKTNLREAIEGHVQTAAQEGMIDTILEQLGISKSDAASHDHLETMTFASSLTVHLPAA